MFSPASNLSLIERLRVKTNDVEENDLIEAFADCKVRDAVGRDDDSDGGSCDGNGGSSKEAQQKYAICETVDDSLCALYSLNDTPNTNTNYPNKNSNSQVNLPYDWILDGPPPSTNETPKSLRRKTFGEPALDNPLELMELEDPSLVTASCSPDSGDTLDEEFADFSRGVDGAIDGHAYHVAESVNKEVDAVQGMNEDDANNCEAEEDWRGFASADVNKAPADQFQQDENDPIEEDSFIGCVVDTNLEYHVPLNGETCEYQPPHEIHQLVNHINAELDITIDECLNTSMNGQSVQEDYFNDSSIVSSLQLPDVPSEEAQAEVQNAEQRSSTKKEYKQSLLMSSVLMETLPLPIPAGDVASFSYRVQKGHVDMLHQTKSEEAIQTEGDALPTQTLHEEGEASTDDIENKLHHTLHSSYFSSGGTDTFDSLVLDEVLNVPWPFHQLDLSEPILEPLEIDPEAPIQDDINFDSYILHRLSQLDVAKGEVMNEIISRVSRKKISIEEGNERILQAELDVATALMYANSSREFLAKVNDYPGGSLDVLDIADTRDRMRYLAETVERIEDVSAQEVEFWKDIPGRNCSPLRAEEYASLIQRAAKLNNLTLEEEVLNHVDCLQSLRERIRGLSGVLLQCLEDSLSDLVRRMISTENSNVCDSSVEYVTLVHAWISCCQLRQENGSVIISQTKVIAEEWSGCLLKVLSFEISKAYVSSLVDALERNTAVEYIVNELDGLKCSLSNDGDVDRLLNRLLDDQRIGSSAFSHLTLRLTEVMSVYSLFLEWHESLIDILRDGNDEANDHMDDDKSENLSSMSADELSSHVSSTIEEEVDDDDDTSDERSGCQLQSFEFTKKATESVCILHECMLKSMNRSIRHPLFTYCESKLTQLVEALISRPPVKLMLEDLRVMDDLFHQFKSFSLYFLGDEHDDDSDTCNSIQEGLTELYHSHLRSVHIEAMKTTGTLLRHESWQLMPIEFSLACTEDDEKKSDGGSCVYDEQSVIMASLVHTVHELLSGFFNHNSKSANRVMVTDRAVLHGHDQCAYLTKYMNNNNHPIRDCHIDAKNLQLRESEALKEFATFVMQFIERQPQLSLSIMTQSSMNGLLKWTARLISIGVTLPSLADETSNAVMTLFDLYILTVFRICGCSKRNEDALIGLIQPEIKSNPSILSLTIEADICSPLPPSDSDSLQNYVLQARKRLENIVNLDRFESSTPVTSSRTKPDLEQVTARLEKDMAAAVSCTFAALLANVASQVLSTCQDSNCNALSNNGDKSFETYAMEVTSMTPQFIRQSCRLSSTHAISGKEVIFQIICVGKTWEDDVIQEYSNTYVEDLHERISEIWALLSCSPTRLPYPVLKYTWDRMVRSAFHTLIEGFAKVTNCSTGGRSLMSMDLTTLSDGLNPDTVKKYLSESYPSINAPPASCYRGEGKQYVDAYIKVFFYPDEVLYQWIAENYKQYREEHILALVTAKRASDSNSDRFWAVLEESIKALYRSQS